MLAFNNIYLGNKLLESPPTDKFLLDLNLSTDAVRKQRFYNRARSKMIAQAIQGRMDQAFHAGREFFRLEQLKRRCVL